MTRYLRHILPSSLLPLGLVALLLAVPRLWSASGPELWPAARYPLAFLIALGLVCLLMKPKLSDFLRAEGAAAALFLVLLTDWFVRPFQLLQGPSVRGLVVVLFIFSFLALQRRFFDVLVRYSAFLFPLIMCLSFFSVSGGELIFSDDHPVNLYRLKLLYSEFPSIPFFLPLWNAGLDARDFFATGILNVGALFSPLFLFLSPEQSYNLIAALIAFAAPAISCFFAARLLGFSAVEQSFASLAASAVSLQWFRWALKYGTLGFCLSMALVPLVYALSLRLMDPEKGKGKERRDFVLLFCALSLCLFWSLSVIVFLPLVPFFLFRARTLLADRAWRRLILALFVFHLPWTAMFVKVSKPFRFVQLEKPSEEAREAGLLRSELALTDGKETSKESSRVRGLKNSSKSLSAALKRFRELAGQSNLLLLLFATPGVFLFGSRFRRLAVFASLSWLLLCASVLVPHHPQLELERMFLPFLFLCSLVSAKAFSALLHEKRSSSFLLSFSFAVLLAANFSGIQLSRGSGWERFEFGAADLDRMVQLLREETSEGRALFPGFCLHELHGGHLAPLALWSGKPLVASSPFHNLWWHTELVPAEVRAQGSEGIEKFFDIYNASLLITHSKKWRRYLENSPERYEFIEEVTPFAFFRRKEFPGYFYEGNGEFLGQDLRSFSLRAGSERLVLRLKYFDFLRSSACELRPFETEYGLPLVELAACPVGEIVRIDSVGPVERLLLGAEHEA